MTSEHPAAGDRDGGTGRMAVLHHARELALGTQPVADVADDPGGPRRVADKLQTKSNANSKSRWGSSASHIDGKRRSSPTISRFGA